jgi:hypothetical protein
MRRTGHSGRLGRCAVIPFCNGGLGIGRDQRHDERAASLHRTTEPIDHFTDVNAPELSWCRRASQDHLRRRGVRARERRCRQLEGELVDDPTLRVELATMQN